MVILLVYTKNAAHATTFGDIFIAEIFKNVKEREEENLFIRSVVLCIVYRVRLRNKRAIISANIKCQSLRTHIL